MKYVEFCRFCKAPAAPLPLNSIAFIFLAVLFWLCVSVWFWPVFWLKVISAPIAGTLLYAFFDRYIRHKRLIWFPDPDTGEIHRHRRLDRVDEDYRDHRDREINGLIFAEAISGWFNRSQVLQWHTNQANRIWPLRSNYRKRMVTVGSPQFSLTCPTMLAYELLQENLHLHDQFRRSRLAEELKGKLESARLANRLHEEAGARMQFLFHQVGATLVAVCDYAKRFPSNSHAAKQIRLRIDRFLQLHRETNPKHVEVWENLAPEQLQLIEALLEEDSEPKPKPAPPTPDEQDIAFGHELLNRVEKNLKGIQAKQKTPAPSAALDQT